MLRLLRPTGLLLVLVLALGVLGAPVASADEEVVRSLDVSYDIRPDGTIDVVYELDWDFGTVGRHGIEFGIVTSEEWDQDPLKEVIYEISDVQVSSPTGAPVDVRETQDSIYGTLDLRIGDPDQTLEEQRHTYVISWTMAGGLRTFDDIPELFLDVTGDDYPPIESFTVTIEAPGPIPRARCMLRETECGATVQDNRAVLTGSDVAPYDIISAVAELKPGSVRNAEPILRERELVAPLLLSMDAEVEIDAQGVAHVEERFTVLVAGTSPSIRWAMPERRAHSALRDQIHETSTPQLTDTNGTVYAVGSSTWGEGTRRQVASYSATLPPEAGTLDLVATYTVSGAVGSRDGVARFAWPISAFSSRQAGFRTQEMGTWKFPGDVSLFGCAFPAGLDEDEPHCFIDEYLSVDGETGTFTWDAVDRSFPRQWVVAEFPAASVGDVQAVTGWSSTARGIAALVIMVISISALAVWGFFTGKLQVGDARDERFTQTAPGVMGLAGMTTRERRDGPVPVRFEPPEASLLEVGLAMDRRQHRRHLTATLVNMGVRGSVELSTLTGVGIQPADFDQTTNRFERRLYRALGASGTKRLTQQQRDGLRRALTRSATEIVAGGDVLVRSGKQDESHLLRLGLAALPLLAAVFLFFSGMGSGLDFAWVMGGALGLVALVLGFRRGVARSSPPRSARGTALQEQADGFRQYLRTAETHQLNFEADQDIFSRYLPWAVLFDEVDRWAKVCQELAAQGRIAQPGSDAVFGASSIGQVSRAVSHLSGSVSPRGSGSGGGGSGGTSGFSGSSGGGGGGGGTSARSW